MLVGLTFEETDFYITYRRKYLTLGVIVTASIKGAIWNYIGSTRSPA